MSEFNFEVNGGESIRLKTAGKYCDRDIVVEGKGGGERNFGLIYTENAVITPEDLEGVNICGINMNSGNRAGGLFLDTKHKSIHFPDTQTYSVGFPYNTNLEEFDSGDNMVATGANGDLSLQSFRNCSNLKRLIMGENYLPFSNYVFTGATSLKEVRYKGTLDKWAEATRNVNTNRANPFFYSKGGSFYLGDSTEPLTEINLTTATTITNGAFVYFTDIEKAFLGETVATLNALCFGYCSKLEALVLKGNTIKTLASTGALSYTPIYEGTGYIYVPSALLEDYKAATNWTTYAEQFRAIEDYPEILGGAE